MGVTLVSLAILYALTALALWSVGRLRRPVPVAAAVAAVFTLGLVLILA